MEEAIMGVFSNGGNIHVGAVSAVRCGNCSFDLVHSDKEISHE
jgi:hypothetical protein